MTIHCNPAAEPASACCKLGSATLTTEPSMKATLEPRMVAASVAAPSPRSTGAAARMAPVSQGPGMAVMPPARPEAAVGHLDQANSASIRVTTGS